MDKKNKVRAANQAGGLAAPAVITNSAGTAVDVPAQHGLRMPAEWQPHAATWIAWPHLHEDWPGKFEAIPWVYVEIVRQLHQAEQVCILVNDAASEAQVARLLARADIERSRIELVRCRTNRVWTRDYGPIFLTGRGNLAVLDWHFTGWAKYSNAQHDQQVAARLCKQRGWPAWRPQVRGQPVVLEGGSIDVNGAGLLLTTEECLLSPVQERNPGLARADYERLFADYLGVKKTFWLDKGIAGDDTHGHIDDLARFVAANRIVTVVEKDKSDINYLPLRENLARLKGMTNVQGKPLEIIELPMPGPVFFDGQRLPASYANFYIASDRVLVPTFNDRHDRVALGILADLFPGRQVIGIHAVDLVWGLGTLHCLTQQQPAV